VSKPGPRSLEWGLTLPPLFWLTLFFVVPTAIVLLYAFKPTELYGGIGEGWTLETIRALFTRSTLILIYRTLYLSLTATLICLILAVPMGFYIARQRPKVQQLLLMLVVLPFWSSFIVRIYAWKSLLHPEGMLKQLLVYLHLVSEETVFLYHPWAVILVMVYVYIPFAILPIFAAAQKFDEQVFEAAMDLGMTRLKAFFKVFLPSIKNGLFGAVLLVLIPTLGAYVIPDMIGGPDTEMLGNKIVQKTFVDRNIPAAAALSGVLFLGVFLPLVFQSLVQKRQGQTHTVKGGH